jgi:hypothetical protein
VRVCVERLLRQVSYCYTRPARASPCALEGEVAPGWAGETSAFSASLTGDDLSRRQMPNDDNIDGGEVLLCVKHERFIDAITHQPSWVSHQHHGEGGKLEVLEKFRSKTSLVCKYIKIPRSNADSQAHSLSSQSTNTCV